MSKEYVIVPKEDYVDTCDAIREKINSTTLLKSDEMAQAIRDIPSPKEEQEKTVDITKNGTTEVLPDEGKVLSKVTVNTNVADSYYDVFWDNFQENGNRKDYGLSFCAHEFTDDIFIPKYDIVPTTLADAFKYSILEDIEGCLNRSGVTLDTSKCTNFAFCFMSSKATSIPTISLISATAISSLFTNCQKLVTLRKLIVKSTTRIPSFTNCNKLQNITIEGEIGTTFDIHWSPLTAESAKSIITHLVNYTGTENEFAYSVLFADSVWELLNAEGATAPGNITWEEYVNSIGWNK